MGCVKECEKTQGLCVKGCEETQVLCIQEESRDWISRIASHQNATSVKHARS